MLPLTTEKNHNVQFNIEVFGEKVVALPKNVQKLNEGDGAGQRPLHKMQAISGMKQLKHFYCYVK